ncbi:MAG: class I SAM-dependent methyltransferase [Xanthomonadales bacterium]|nr:class I SAM-dependent methyltransferase [Xanthomonadales bacterium]
MYRFEDYSNMLRDPVRTVAYRKALDRLVKPDSVVLDLGAGTGAFALYAASLGARRVYAVELSPLLDYGKREAERMGLGERIRFHFGRSEDFEVDEPANILVSDLRGALPFFGSAFDTLNDALRRLLSPDASILPSRDRLFVAPIEDEHWYQAQVREPWIGGEIGLDMPVLARVEANMPRRPVNSGMMPSMEGKQFAEIDYKNGPSIPEPAQIEWRVTTPTTVHAWLVWFEAELLPGITISAAPGLFSTPQVYGRLLFPVSSPIMLVPGDLLRVRIAVLCLNGSFTYRWTSSAVDSGGRNRSLIHQHSGCEYFLGLGTP